MCLRSVHSLQSFVRHSFRSISLRCISLHYFLTTSFRSFHPPQHRTQEKLLSSFQECNRTVSFRCSFRVPIAASPCIGNRTASLHSLQFFALIQSLHLFLARLFENRYALFFSAKCLPQPSLQILWMPCNKPTFIFYFFQWQIFFRIVLPVK